ncbi:cellulose biosynthesis protein BcsC [Solimonas flava]|uniref:cellulose biosynthesis protein BcsC n=1 Tax=Solimonas flava TaxID=415849 RepID=UPI0004021F14|nr:cellulose biosynthesis protein BcsC [Solimonas flava]
MRRLLAVALLAASGNALAADSADAVLWRSAWVWEAHGRGDLALDSLTKLQRSRPDDLDIALQMGLLELRSGRFEDANRRLAAMRAQAPDAAATHELDTAYRVLTRDRIKLASIRRLLEISEYEQALAALRELFPDGPPGHDLGIEYYRVIGRTPNGWNAARDGFEKLVADNPTDPRYLLALAEHLATRPATRPRALALFAELAERDDVRHEPVMNAWKEALEDAGPGEVTPAMRARYARLAPDDAPALQVPSRAAAAPAAAEAASAAAPAETAAEAEARKANALAEAEARQRAAAQAAAEAEAQRARRQAQAEARAAADEGDRLRESGALAEALAVYEQAAAREPTLARTLLGRVRTLAALRRYDEGFAVADAFLAQAPDASTDVSRARAVLYEARGEQALTEGRTEAGVADLAQALQATPDDPWLRYALARGYARLGQAERGRTLMAEGTALAPADADSRYAQSLYLSAIDADADALQALQAVPAAQRSAGMQRQYASLQVAVSGRAAVEAQRGGDLAAAQNHLLTAQLAAGHDPALLGQLAQYWVAIGDAEAALAVLDAPQAATDAAGRAELGVARLRVLEAAGDDAALRKALDALPADAPATVAAAAASLRRGLVQREADAALAKGDPQAQLAVYEQALGQSGDAGLRRLYADALAAQQRWPQAESQYAQLLAGSPDDAGLRLDHARTLEESGQRKAARAEIDVALQHASGDAAVLRSAARRLQALGDYEAARRALDAAGAAGPRDADWLAQSARLSELSGHDTRAVREYRAALAQRPDDAALSAALAGLAAQRHAEVIAGLDWQSKAGEPGYSDTRSLQLPVEISWPWRYDGQLFAHADVVDLDAGRLPGNYDDASLFGSVQASGPDAVLAFPSGLEQSATGVALAVGYTSGGLRLDLGTSPLGFPVQDLLGGIRYDGELGPLDYSIDLARRPVTSTLLSYAGTRDPVTHEIWGGVRENGLTLGLAQYGGALSWRASLGASYLDGRNVADNRYIGGSAGADYRLYDRNAQRVYIGLGVRYWDYEKNLRYYTLGHGGYYSPQRYLSLSLPLEWQGHSERWSYQLQAALSHTNSREDDAPFYPDDAALQARAALSPLPPHYTRPVYDGGSSSGWGRSLQARIEYALDGDWAIGLRGALDRSDYYEPNFLTLYVRRLLLPGTVLRAPPEPPRPYADY